ncbi:FG-GAP repeat domain-containing protein [Cystobacter fuscus]
MGAHDVSLVGLGGRWTNESHVELGGRVRALAAGEFTGDGRVDLAALDDRGQVLLLAGQGGGAFERSTTPLATLPLAQASARWSARMFSGDFNGDGRDDLLLSSSELGVTLLSSSGFGYRASSPFAPGTSVMAVADLDREGRMDVVLSSGSRLSTHLSLGDGTFVVSWEEGRTPRGATFLRDFTGDGFADLLVHQTLFVGQPGGRFALQGSSTWARPIGMSSRWATGTRTEGWTWSGRSGMARGRASPR